MEDSNHFKEDIDDESKLPCTSSSVSERSSMHNRVLQLQLNRKHSLSRSDSFASDDTSTLSSDSAPKRGKPKRTTALCERRSNPSLPYTLIDHFYVFFFDVRGYPIYGTKFNPYLADGQYAFCNVAGRFANIFTYINATSTFEPLCSFNDSDEKESFFCCCWLFLRLSNEFAIAIAGCRGIIRIISARNCSDLKNLKGHGGAINDLAVHPYQTEFLLSASQDHTIRLWNTDRDVCIAIFGGCEGHRDEVISIDFDMTGDRFVSGGMDHCIKVWRIDTEPVLKAINESRTVARKKRFKPIKMNFPECGTRDVHKNYVDCVKYFGDLIVSKSVEQEIIVWKFGDMTSLDVDTNESNASILYRFDLPDSENWYIRFDVNLVDLCIACGNKEGKIHLYDLSGENFEQKKDFVLDVKRCKKNMSQVSFSSDGRFLIGGTFDSVIWCYERIDQLANQVNDGFSDKQLNGSNEDIQ